ncbi:MAG: hypothetical protein RLZZ435_739 [Cyanobacteriota bacterium]|jgi:hypothetical protein
MGLKSEIDRPDYGNQHFDMLQNGGRMLGLLRLFGYRSFSLG